MDLHISNSDYSQSGLPHKEDPLVHSSVFREYDIRGLANSEITNEFALSLGVALGELALSQDQQAFFVGRDVRLSSKSLTEALCSGLEVAGCHVINLGEVTTPIVNFSIEHDPICKSGVMVTASHNPAAYNGFKIILDGEVVSGQQLQELKSALKPNNVSPDVSAPQITKGIISQYCQHIISNSSIDRSFKLVIDAGNSVAGPIAIDLFKGLGCAVESLYCDIDGSFPNHDPNPSDEKNLQDLIAKVVSTGSDLGFAYDGDGDRLVVISESGDIVWPDRLMMIFAKDLLEKTPGGGIVFDIKSSMRLKELVMECGGFPTVCKTGHSHIRKSVRDQNAVLGGEFSGHIFFNDRWGGFDDGLYAGMRLLEILCQQHNGRIKLLDEIVSEFKTSSYSPEILIPAPDNRKFLLMDSLQTNCIFDGGKITRLDGIRVEYSGGWGLIRASNTTPNLTLRFEADDDAQLAEIKTRFRRELNPFINQLEDYI